MSARVEALVQDEDGCVREVCDRASDGWHELRTQLVIGPMARPWSAHDSDCAAYIPVHAREDANGP
jgi:hypothetical protein